MGKEYDIAKNPKEQDEERAIISVYMEGFESQNSDSEKKYKGKLEEAFNLGKQSRVQYNNRGNNKLAA